MFQSVAKIELRYFNRLVTPLQSARWGHRQRQMYGEIVQTTIKSPVEFTGTGLHSGAPVRLTIRPASADHGIWFRRTDILIGDALIPAKWDAVVQSPLCTRLRNQAGAEISTVEHIMAALAGCGIQNALVEVNGPEVPILDGSAAPFVEGILWRGVRHLSAPVWAIEILRPVTVRHGEATATLSPSEAFEIAFEIDFDEAAIGRQSKTLNMANGAFVRELCDSRTFCRQSDIENMRANGLALGGTLSNAVVVDGATILSPGGLRHRDEAVRHKMLDAVGDLALAGAPIFGQYSGNRAGHSLTNKLLRALFAQPDAFRIVECDADAARRLPGVGVSFSDMPAVA